MPLPFMEEEKEPTSEEKLKKKTLENFSLKIDFDDNQNKVKIMDIKYVYFISDGTAIKIGRSSKPLSRLKELQTGNPRELKLLGTSHILEESEVHKMFETIYIRGEWFGNESVLFEYCKKYKTKHFELSQKSKEELIKIILEENKIE